LGYGRFGHRRPSENGKQCLGRPPTPSMGRQWTSFAAPSAKHRCLEPSNSGTPPIIRPPPAKA
jgi:hypothetical protein